MKAQLGNQPKMKWQGLSVWTPMWSGSSGPFPTGERGVLKDVKIFEADRIGPRRLMLTIDYLGHRFTGDLTFDAPEMVNKVCDVLKGCADQDLSDVGAIELEG
jgi:hypothetical protein